MHAALKSIYILSFSLTPRPEPRPQAWTELVPEPDLEHFEADLHLHLDPEIALASVPEALALPSLLGRSLPSAHPPCGLRLVV